MFFLSAELISVLCPETSAFFLVIYFPSLADMNSEHLNVDFSILCTLQRKKTTNAQLKVIVCPLNLLTSNWLKEKMLNHDAHLLTSILT